MWISGIKISSHRICHTHLERNTTLILNHTSLSTSLSIQDLPTSSEPPKRGYKRLLVDLLSPPLPLLHPQCLLPTQPSLQFLHPDPLSPSLPSLLDFQPGRELFSFLLRFHESLCRFRGGGCRSLGLASFPRGSLDAGGEVGSSDAGKGGIGENRRQVGDGWIQRVEEMEDRRQQGRRDRARRHRGHIIGFEISKSVLKRVPLMKLKRYIIVPKTANWYKKGERL